MIQRLLFSHTVSDSYPTTYDLVVPNIIDIQVELNIVQCAFTKDRVVATITDNYSGRIYDNIQVNASNNLLQGTTYATQNIFVYLVTLSNNDIEPQQLIDASQDSVKMCLIYDDAI